MTSTTRQKLTSFFSATSLLCPLALVVIIILMRTGALRFHDDMTGFGGVSFFLICALGLLPSGLLSASIALVLTQRSGIAWTGLTLNLGLLIWGFLLFR
jgi:hypothetical protein